MADPLGLRPEDRADFEAVPQLALNTPALPSALRAAPTGRAVTRLRLRALADAHESAARRPTASAARTSPVPQYSHHRLSPRPPLPCSHSATCSS